MGGRMRGSMQFERQSDEDAGRRPERWHLHKLVGPMAEAVVTRAEYQGGDSGRRLKDCRVAVVGSAADTPLLSQDGLRGTVSRHDEGVIWNRLDGRLIAEGAKIDSVARD